ncbi:MAG: hypothetical protein U0Y82_04740 [Thermoleophilia bacterium]
MFTTLDTPSDPTFNQLLGINNAGVISGYFGNGSPPHPNRGFTLTPPSATGTFRAENVPGSVQTQVTGLNNRGVTVGFWADPTGDNYGFVAQKGRFTQVFNPMGILPTTGAPAIQQLLGVNDKNIAVGFFADAGNNNHGFTYNVATGRFTSVNVAGFLSVTPTAINTNGAVAGFVQAGANTEGFVLDARGVARLLRGPQGATASQALGINATGEVVGSWVDAQGNTHGFSWTAQNGYTVIDDPNAHGMTVVNGLNDRGQLVGFFQDAAGNTNGMLVTMH